MQHENHDSSILDSSSPPSNHRHHHHREVNDDCLGSNYNASPDEEEEKLHFEKIVNGFRLYRMHYLHRVALKAKYCPSMDDRIVPYKQLLKDIQQCISANALILNYMIHDICGIFDNRDYSDLSEDVEAPLISQSSPSDQSHNNHRVHTVTFRKGTKPSIMDMDKTASVLRQIVREWTVEGEEERQQSFQLLIDAVERHITSSPLGFECKERQNYQILVPGAGLGRLAFELAKRGFSTQGNEHSYFMLFASNFILNKCRGVFLYDFHPWIHQINNNKSASDQLRKLSFPDADPSSIPPGVSFSMAAGNFIDVYTAGEYASYFDCVVTCFFIDTAHNVLDYIDTIYKTLKDGGLWINLGPLLYHFADMAGEDSIEPPYDILKEMIRSSGFDFEEERTDIRCSYTQNSKSMLSYVYDCVFFVCRKKVKNPTTL